MLYHILFIIFFIIEIDFFFVCFLDCIIITYNFLITCSCWFVCFVYQNVCAANCCISFCFAFLLHFLFWLVNWCDGWHLLVLCYLLFLFFMFSISSEIYQGVLCNYNSTGKHTIEEWQRNNNKRLGIIARAETIIGWRWRTRYWTRITGYTVTWSTRRLHINDLFVSINGIFGIRNMMFILFSFFWFVCIFSLFKPYGKCNNIHILISKQLSFIFLQ